MNNIKTMIMLLVGFVSMVLSASQSDSATISADSRYTAIAAGVTHAIALKSDGSLWAWGNNDHGQLGDGSTNRSLAPKRIGTGFYSAIAAGGYHTVALKSDGSLWAWGSNAYGQLGDGVTTDSFVPKQIGTGSYTAISAGGVHTIALKSDGSLWAWGSNASGRLGDGSTTDSLVPKQIGTGSYAAIAAGGGHTIALKSDGSLWAWGSNDSGQLGDGSTSSSLLPKQIGTGSYTAITAGMIHTFALKSDGSLWAWGSNFYGQFGDGAITDSLLPKQIGTGSYSMIAAGVTHTIALRPGGSLWAWGRNNSGQLGYATTTGSYVPKQIGTDSYSAIAAGGDYTVAVKSDGSLWAWGSNYYGQLGVGSITDSLVPKQIIDTGYIPDTTAPSVPAGLTATTVASTGTNYVTLFWTPSTDDVGVNEYKVYRNGSLISIDSLYRNALDNSYSIADGLPTDNYTVSACDISGNCSAQSAAASVISGTQTPSVPAGLTAIPISATQINLSWTSSVDNIGVTQYEIYRASVGVCPALAPHAVCDAPPHFNTKLLVKLSGNPPQTSYDDTGLSPSASYLYMVRACNAIGNCSATRAEITTETPSLPIILRTPPTATGTSFGPLSNQTIRITMTPPLNVPNLDVGTKIFVAAVVPSSMGGDTYLWTYESWVPYTTCAASQVASKWELSTEQQFDVVSTPTDLLSLKGTKIYVGYGSGATNDEACIDMLNRSTYTQAYTIN